MIRLTCTRILALATCLDLLAELCDRGADAVTAFQKSAELERQLLVYRRREGREHIRRATGDGIAGAVDLARQQLQRIHVVSEALCTLTFLADLLLRGGEGHDSAAD